MFAIDWFRESAMEGLLVPTLMLIFISALFITFACDWLITRLGLYDLVWHASLFRVSLFVLIFSGLALLIY